MEKKIRKSLDLIAEISSFFVDDIGKVGVVTIKEDFVSSAVLETLMNLVAIVSITFLSFNLYSITFRF